VYLTFAEFDADYVDYVCGLVPRNVSVLKMREYGPFLPDEVKHMRNLGPILLAWSIEECT